MRESSFLNDAFLARRSIERPVHVEAKHGCTPAVTPAIPICCVICIHLHLRLRPGHRRVHNGAAAMSGREGTEGQTDQLDLITNAGMWHCS